VTLDAGSRSALENAVGVTAIAFNRRVRAIEWESGERVIKFTVARLLCQSCCGRLRQSKAADK
jgi:hypothetical protein